MKNKPLLERNFWSVTWPIILDLSLGMGLMFTDFIFSESNIRAGSGSGRKSIINLRHVVTYWDNVTVHDHAFYQHQYELVKDLQIFRPGLGDDYERYMHVEVDSN